MPLVVGARVILSRPEWPNAFRRGQSGIVEAIEDDKDRDSPPINPGKHREPVIVTVLFGDGGRGFHLPRELESC